MLKFWIAFYFLSGYCEGNSFVTRPRDVAAIIGGTANFSCKVDFESSTNFQGIQWTFNNEMLYSFETGKEYYGKVNKTYSVQQDGRTFNLSVTELRFADGGLYTCKILNDKAIALLTVIGTPQISNGSAVPMENSTTEVRCTAQFAGPIEGDTLNYPHLKMFLDGVLLDGTVKEQKYNSSTNQFEIAQIHNMTLKGSMNAKKLVCDLGISCPVTHANVTTEITVLYSVCNITYTPHRKIYDVGNEVTCMAQGNPDPAFQWSTMDKGDYIDGSVLVISEKMIGSNLWECTASNIISGKPEQITVSAEFDVDDQCGKSGNGTWKIAMGVTIPVLIIIICLAVFIIKKNWKRQKLTITEKTGSSASCPDEERLLENSKGQKDTSINEGSQPLQENILLATVESSNTEDTDGLHLMDEESQREVMPHNKPKPVEEHVTHACGNENTGVSHPKDEKSQAEKLTSQAGAQKDTSNISAEGNLQPPAEPKQVNKHVEHARGNENTGASQPKAEKSKAKSVQAGAQKDTSKVSAEATARPKRGHKTASHQGGKENADASHRKDEMRPHAKGNVRPATKQKPSGKGVSTPGVKENTDTSHPKDEGSQAKRKDTSKARAGGNSRTSTAKTKSNK